MRVSKGEHWLLKDGREVILTWVLPRGRLRVLTDDGQLEVIEESLLKSRLTHGALA